VDAALPSSSKW